MTHIKILLRQIDFIKEQISCYDTLNTSISEANVAWHLEHTLRTIDEVSKALIRSAPHKYQWKWSWIKIWVLFFKTIPRGKAKAPKIVQPSNEISSSSLMKHIVDTEKYIQHLVKLPTNKYFHHPYLGDMKLKESIKFLEIHTRHHLSIIEDIIRAS